MDRELDTHLFAGVLARGSEERSSLVIAGPEVPLAARTLRVFATSAHGPEARSQVRRTAGPAKICATNGVSSQQRDAKRLARHQKPLVRLDRSVAALCSRLLAADSLLPRGFSFWSQKRLEKTVVGRHCIRERGVRAVHRRRAVRDQKKLAFWCRFLRRAVPTARRRHRPKGALRLS